MLYILEFKSFRLSRTKIEYMEYKFSKNRNKDKGALRLNIVKRYQRPRTYDTLDQ